MESIKNITYQYMKFRSLDQGMWHFKRELFLLYSNLFSVIMIFWEKMYHPHDNAEIITSEISKKKMKMVLLPL